MRGKAIVTIAAVVSLVFALSGRASLSQQVPTALNMIVLAPSVSTSIEARSLLARLRWTETRNWKTADGILVVVRSALPLPLRLSYESVCELTEDAERQLNIAGPDFHVYVFTISDELSVTQRDHQSYPAR